MANPLSATLLPRQYSALLGGACELTGMAMNDTRFILTNLVGGENDTTFEALWSIDDDSLLEFARNRNVAISPRARKRLVAFCGAINLATPVISLENGEVTFPYTVQDDTIQMAKAGDSWAPADDPWNSVIVPEPDPTHFGINPYTAIICGPETRIHMIGGTRLPILSADIEKAFGPAHSWWKDALRKYPTANLTLVVGVLLHHADWQRFAGGVPERALAAIREPSQVSIFQQQVCERIVRAASKWWRTCYDSYIALVQESRVSATVSTSATVAVGGTQSATPSVSSEDGVSNLKELFMACFSKSELSRFLSNKFGSRITGELPGGSVSPAEYAFQAANLLDRRGLITSALFQQMIEERPYRKSDIMAVAKSYGL